MTKAETVRITALRKEGKGSKMIAAELGLPLNSVKSWCRRHPVGEDGSDRCRQCGKSITVIPGKKTRLFCSDACRNAWWSAHPEARKPKTLYSHVCRFCGKEFQSDRAGTQFCDRKCFSAYRRKDAGHGS